MTRARLVVLTFGLLVGCSGGSGGCLAFQPLPDTERFEGEKMDHAASVRLGPGGFTVLNTQWEQILNQFAPNKRMDIPLPCTIQNFFPLGNVAIADQGAAGCTSESCGQLDGQCDAQDVPLVIPVTFSSLRLDPQAPDVLAASVEASIATGKIMIDTVSRNHATCLFQNPAKCAVEVDTTRSGAATNTLQANIQFTIDTRWDRLLSFTVASVQGTQLCGLPGAPPAPRCLEPNDVVVTSEGPCQTCNAGDWAPVKAAVLALVGAEIKKNLQQALDAATCQPCGPSGACPQLGTSTSTCNSSTDRCEDPVTQRCVPALLGVEGRLSGAPPSQVDLSLALGGSAVADTGLTLGLRGGAKELSTGPCVRTLAPEPMKALGAAPFDAEASAPYDVGLSVSAQMLNRLLHHTQQSGALCSALTTTQVSQIDSGLFTPLLPSLKLLTTRDDRPVPMMVAIRPMTPPKLYIGAGTVDPVTRAPQDPLLRLTITDLEVDFYALLEDRQARLFTLQLNLSIPMGLVFEGCSTVTPVIGSLQSAVTKVQGLNSEILAEDLATVEALVPAFVGLAEPALSSAVSAFTLPTLNGFKIKVSEAKGLLAIPGTPHFDHLGMYAQILPSQAQCAVAGPIAEARIDSTRIPLPEELTGRKGALPWPVAVLGVSSGGRRSGFSVSVRVNQGFWSEFQTIEAGQLEVTHPAFLLQGDHRIEVRTRQLESPYGISAPIALRFRVDLERPWVRLEPDRPTQRMRVRAYDRLTPHERLEYAYRLGDGSWSEFGPPRVVELSAVEEAGRLAVRVRDEAGLWAEAAVGVPTTLTGPDSEREGEAPARPGAGGCTSVPLSAGWALWVWIQWLGRRRTRRRQG